MAALTYRAAISANGRVTVTRSTGDSISTATAALIIDNTASWHAVEKAVRALRRALSRDHNTDSKPSAIATTGSSVE